MTISETTRDRAIVTIEHRWWCQERNLAKVAPIAPEKSRFTHGHVRAFVVMERATLKVEMEKTEPGKNEPNKNPGFAKNRTEAEPEINVQESEQNRTEPYPGKEPNRTEPKPYVYRSRTEHEPNFLSTRNPNWTEPLSSKPNTNTKFCFPPSLVKRPCLTRIQR